jgi:hypothetical protein
MIMPGGAALPHGEDNRKFVAANQIRSFIARRT